MAEPENRPSRPGLALLWPEDEGLCVSSSSRPGDTSPSVPAAEPLPGAASTSQLFARVPFNRLLGLQREHASDGTARLTLDASTDLTNVHAAVHGGALMSLMDSAMGSAALSAMNFTKGVVTIDMTSSFLRPAHGRLTAHASVEGGGKSICFCECRVEDQSGQVVARAMGSFRYVRP